MSKLQRIVSILIGLMMVACGIALLLAPKDGLVFVSYVLGFAIMAYGVRMLVYYLTMARHMTSGLSVLFIAVITIDISVFALALVGDPKISIVIYLVVYNMITGVLSIARGIESKLFGSSWVPNVLHGIVNIVLAALCVAFVGSDQIVIIIFCIGLFYSAVARIVTALRPTEIIYIQ